MTKTRRGFLGSLAALVAAPWGPKPPFDWYRTPIPLPKDAIVFKGVTIIPDAPVFHGSFQLGEVTRRVAQGRLRKAFDRTWDHQMGLMREFYRDPPAGTLAKRVRETTKDLGE